MRLRPRQYSTLLLIPLALTLTAAQQPAGDPDSSDGGAAQAPAAPPPLPPASGADPGPEGKPSELAHPDDVVDYTLTASLDPRAHTIHGEGTIRWRNTSVVPVREVWLHLYLNAFKSDKTVFMRERVGGRGSATLTDHGHIDVAKLDLLDGADGADGTGGGSSTPLWPKAELRRGNDEDETDARVPLPREVAPNETVTFSVQWDDKLPSVLERTGYAGSFHMAGQWFPKLARLEQDGTWAHFSFHHLAEFYADFGTYDVTLDVPEAFLIGATGSVAEARVAGGRRIERHVQGDVHDFAWTAWDKWQAISETIDGVAVRVLFPPGYRVVAQRELKTMEFSIPYFGARYGRYPYPLLTLVHPPAAAPEAGGMEYPTLITTGIAPWWGPPGVFVAEFITMHEFGHQYFYGLLASDEVTYPFLDEGINSYAEQDGMRAFRGPGSVVDLAGLTISDSAQQAVTSNAAASNEPVAQPAPAFDTGADYGALVYNRTGAVMETLRRVYGDAPMARAMALYTQRYRFRHPRPDDFLATMGEVLGDDAARTLRTALFEKGWVDYVATNVASSLSGDGSGLYDGVAIVTRRGTLAFPVDVELDYADGSSEVRRWDGVGGSTHLRVRAKSALKSVVVDPAHSVTIDADLTNNHVTDDGSTRAWRTLERVTYWAELLVQAVSP